MRTAVSTVGKSLLAVAMLGATVPAVAATFPAPALGATQATYYVAPNGDDANSSPGPQIAPGSPVTWTYTVTNTGDVALSNVQVTDPFGTVPVPLHDQL